MSGFVPHPFAFHWSKLEAVGVLQVTQKLHGALEEIDRGERSYVQLLLSNIGVIYDAMLRAGMDLRWDRINEKQVEDAAAAALSPSAARGAAAGARPAEGQDDGSVSKWNEVLKWRVSTVVSGAAARGTADWLRGRTRGGVDHWRGRPGPRGPHPQRSPSRLGLSCRWFAATAAPQAASGSGGHGPASRTTA